MTEAYIITFHCCVRHSNGMTCKYVVFTVLLICSNYNNKLYKIQTLGSIEWLTQWSLVNKVAFTATEVWRYIKEASIKELGFKKSDFLAP